MLVLIGIDLGLAYAFDLDLSRAGRTDQGWFYIREPALSGWYVPVYTIGLWILCGATAGKILVGIRVVDRDGVRIGPLRAVGRYRATILSALPFGLGFLRVAVGPAKRGWHDHIAGTEVVTVG